MSIIFPQIKQLYKYMEAKVIQLRWHQLLA